ncbi:hypothetical protein JYK14_12300 [Siccirubricoccus sp. KC 17139]|uniref:Glycosyltransferase n=1 Tax=Siccirubricoccus soli TaxID=2899147 RepID=A0ABT1D4T4_9PROT|nr:hypothetical protein [Siccirubricoccus soli]MCO6416936.1 hypothetical protein [Siccirubricoccus soli]MCP2683071.1 hypothetical protein [Siccirubricoccus soli]
MIATPCYGAMVHQGYMLSVLRLLQDELASEVAFTLEMLGHDSLITRSRNTLLARFLQRPDATHILFVDADISFEPVQLRRMLRAGKELVAGLYPLKVQRWDAAARRQAMQGESLATAPLLYVGQPCSGAEAEREGDFVTGTYAGSGFMLARRDMVERMAASYPETGYRHVDAANPAVPDGTACHALFDCVIDPESGTYLSEDFTFCRRWRAIGGKLWLDTRGRLTHTGAHDFAGDPTLRFLDIPAHPLRERAEA